MWWNFTHRSLFYCDKKNRKNEKKKKEGSWKFVKPTIVKFCTKWLISPLFVVVLYLWIDWELDVMGTPTKVYSLIKSLLSITCVYLKRELQVSKAWVIQWYESYSWDGWESD